jgi:site-specific DNA-methyltransferase (adenine-specific)
MIELNNFYIGESVTFMRDNIPDNFVDLTITSPPYDNLRKYNGYVFDYQNLGKELFRITTDGGVLVWIVGDNTVNFCESLSSFKQALYFVNHCGFKLLDTMIYYKQNYAPAYPTLRRYANQFEYMFVFVKGNKPKTFNPIQKEKVRNKEEKVAFRQQDGNLIRKTKEKGRETKDASNVWKYSTGGSCTNDKLAFNHPAIFPEKLAQDHILSWSNEGDVVLDPMCGSGTTCKMAYLNNRNFIGIDMSEEYINNICKPRLNTYGLEFKDNNICGITS